MTTGSRSPVRWLAVLLVPVIALALAAMLASGRSVTAASASPTGGAQQPCLFCSTTSDGGTTTLPATTLPEQSTTTAASTTVPSGSTTSMPGVGGSYSASFGPCYGRFSCDQTPTVVEVTYPVDQPPAAVKVAFLTYGRPAGAPGPASNTVVLGLASSKPCTAGSGAATGQGTAASCWAWPVALLDSGWVLDGTYQVTSCGSSVQGSCDQALSPVTIGVAVAPAAPRSVSATAGGGTVVVTWKPPALAPPDLAGYSVARNGSVVWECSLGGLGTGPTCPNSPNLADHPGNGRFSYAVSALRLGVNAAPDSVVSSSFAGTGSSVTVTGASSGTGAADGGNTANGPGGGSAVALGPVPLAGIGPGAGTVTVGPTLAGPVAVPEATAAKSPDVAGSPANLSYPSTDEPVVGKAPGLALKEIGSTSHTDIAPVAVLALGILSLAVAAHFLYLRVELAALEARRATGRSDLPS